MEILSDTTFKGNVTFNKSVSFDGCIMAFNSATFSQHVIFEKTATVDKFFQVGHNSSSTGTELAVGGNTFITGNTLIGGDFSITQSDFTSPLVKAKKTDGSNTYSLYVNGSEWIEGSTRISGDLIAYSAFITEFYPIHISLDDGKIDHWSDLNNILCFAPSSLSCTVSSLCTTVSSHTTKINSACSTISSLCTKVNSLCTTVASNTTKINSLCTKVDNIQLNPKHTFANPTLPIGCTKFYFVDNVMDNGGYGNDYYKFRVNSTGIQVSSFQVFKGGSSGINEEVQIDIKQNFCKFDLTRWFEGTLASNITGYDESEFIIVFDEFKEMYPESVPQ